MPNQVHHYVIDELEAPRQEHEDERKPGGASSLPYMEHHWSIPDREIEHHLYKVTEKSVQKPSIEEEEASRSISPLLVPVGKSLI